MERLHRLPAVEGLTGYKRSTLYRLIKANKFPPPIALGARAVAWPESAISAWIQERIANSRTNG